MRKPMASAKAKHSPQTAISFAHVIAAHAPIGNDAMITLIPVK
jgi:hypothetical protein